MQNEFTKNLLDSNSFPLAQYNSKSYKINENEELYEYITKIFKKYNLEYDLGGLKMDKKECEDVVNELKKFIENIYEDNHEHVLCLEYPIIKLLSEKNNEVSRNELIDKLSIYGAFKRGALSFDHLWSHRFGKGEESDLLNMLIEHDGENAGDRKTTYRLKDDCREAIKKAITEINKLVQDEKIKDLIQKRLDYVNKKAKGLAIADSSANSWIKDGTNAIWWSKAFSGKKSTEDDLKKELSENGFFYFYIISSHKIIYRLKIIDFDEPEINDDNNPIYPISWNEPKSVLVDKKKRAKWCFKIESKVKMNTDEKELEFGSSKNENSEPTQNNLQPVRNVVMTNEEKLAERNKQLLEYQKQIILQGPPGTGKTRLAKQIARQMIHMDRLDEEKVKDLIKKIEKPLVLNTISSGSVKFKIISDSQYEISTGNKHYINLKNIVDCIEKKCFNNVSGTQNNKQGTGPYDVSLAKYLYETEANKAIAKYSKLIQFHPSYSYEDFVRGIVAEPIGKSVSYSAKDKVLAKMADDACKDPNNKYILIIDEINRANLSSVLGELIYALEYRDESVESMYEVEGNNKITLPSNLYIIGTMNTADRSIGHIDYAIRRRFTFLDVLSNGDNVLDQYPLGKKLYTETVKIFSNEYVSPEFILDDIKIGHSYFIAIKKGHNEDIDKLATKYLYQVLPLLNEYVKDGVFQKAPIIELRDKKIDLEKQVDLTIDEIKEFLK